ncbi:MAG: lysophospholipid acyltransferase family protein [Candidatus Omnitrophica bacterium]|nr:lysophospholipid acyltransferase family protein [Candidatus Omnitrophota bacterium]
MMYLLYRVGQFMVLRLPIKVGYWLAERIADIHRRTSPHDTANIITNIKLILKVDDKKAEYYAKSVFRNFGRYLVDFLRFSRLDKGYVQRFVVIEGLEHLDKVLARGKGCIGITAHLGNWELGGAILSILGYPVNAVALSHADKNVNNFFTKQREITGIKVIPTGVAVRRCFSALANNEFLALLGDRDFANDGIPVEFFGTQVALPKGPAALSLKTGASILPGFLVREDRDHFRLIIEQPIEYSPTGNSNEDLVILTRRIAEVMERYISKYPTQWYMFNNFFEKGLTG